jgi:hypothetical protein
MSSLGQPVMIGTSESILGALLWPLGHEVSGFMQELTFRSGGFSGKCRDCAFVGGMAENVVGCVCGEDRTNVDFKYDLCEYSLELTRSDMSRRC